MMISHPLGWLRRLGAAGLVLLALCGAHPLGAQGVTTTGQIRGQITDERGAPVGNAQVVATSEETGLRRGDVTRADGTYTIRLLPPGRYAVRAEMVGRAPAQQGGVQVAIGGSATINLRLATTTVALQGLTVTAERRAVDATEGSVKQLVTPEQIQNLPALGRDFTDFINLSGLVTPTPEVTTGGQFAIAGQRASQTSIQIDGVDANNAFFGENRGGSRIPFVFSLESIREFEIITNGWDVEYGSYSGGIVNVVTRGGTNQFGGTAYVNYRGDALTAKNFNGSEPRDYEVTQYAGRVSGPIVRDKAFFLFSFDGQRRREPQLPLTQQRFSPEGASPSPAVFGEVGRFFEVLENQYGVADAASGFRAFQTSNDVITLFGRVDWAINDDHRLSLRHNYSSYSNEDEWNPNFDFIYGLSRAENYKGSTNSFVTELQSVFGENTFNVFRFQFADEGRPRNGRELRPALIVNLSDGERIGYGGTFASYNNDLQERKLQFINNFTHVAGAHTLKLGGNGIFTNILNQFIINGAGEYNFRNLDDFAAFRPSSYSRNVLEGGGIPRAEFDVTEWSVYGQDEWQITPKLTTTFGLRYDLQRFENAPARVIAAEQALGITSGIAPEDNDNISPRFSFAYDFNGDASSVLRGGVGYFYGRVPYVLGGNVESTIRPVLTLRCTGSIGEGDPDAPPSPSDFAQWSPDGSNNPGNCARTSQLTGVPTYTFWNGDFEFPETLKANLGYEHLFGDATRASVDLILSQSSKLFTVRNLNLRDAQFELEAEGGRRIFQPAEIFDPAISDNALNRERSSRNLELAEIYANYNDGRARAFTGVFELSHNLSERTRLAGSYTWTRAYDNGSFGDATSSGLFSDQEVGIYGPNELGDFGDAARGWGRSGFMREHTFIVTGNTRLPLGIEVSGTWRLQSGRPWTPEVGGDLNGDGIRFNDRGYVFRPEELPLAATDPEQIQIQSARYARYLAENECLGDYTGQVLERNTCTFPWTNQLDLRLSRQVRTARGQRAELQVDLFNVLNGLNSDWGRYVGVFGANRNFLRPVRYDAESNQILYEVPDNFGREEAIGANLIQQFQAQIGLKYYF